MTLRDDMARTIRSALDYRSADFGGRMGAIQSVNALLAPDSPIRPVFVLLGGIATQEAKNNLYSYTAFEWLVDHFHVYGCSDETAQNLANACLDFHWADDLNRWEEVKSTSQPQPSQVKSEP